MFEKRGKVNDATDVFRIVLDYLLSRVRERYSTIDEAKEDVNKIYKEVMQVIQQNYDRFFQNELFSNLGTYGIEILGTEDEVIIEDQVMDNSDIVDENEMGNENVGKDFFDENENNEAPRESEQ